MILFNLDVLARPHNEFGSRVPDPEGLMLWRAMHEHSMGRIAVVVNTAPDRSVVEHWLKINQIKAASYDLLDSLDSSIIAEKVQLYLGAAGGRHMYFDTNPDVITLTLSAGIPSTLVCQPYVVRPEWNGPRAIQSWESLTAEIDKQKLARAEKNWGELE